MTISHNILWTESLRVVNYKIMLSFSNVIKAQIELLNISEVVL